MGCDFWFDGEEVWEFGVGRKGIIHDFSEKTNENFLGFSSFACYKTKFYGIWGLVQVRYKKSTEDYAIKPLPPSVLIITPVETRQSS